MRAITARRSMRRCIKLLESNDGSLSHDQLCQLWSDKSTQTALSILDHKGYVSILFADDEPYSIALTGSGSLYLVERSELWLNRVVSFFAGVASTVLAAWLSGLVTF